MIAQGGQNPTAAPRTPPKQAALARSASSSKQAVARPTAEVAPAGLVYVSDELPGITRRRRGDSFVYHLPDGRPLRDKAEIDRIRRLAIPPAYTDVWICTQANGHLQATGRDARGRKQYRYHAEWRVARDADKFARMLEFGHVLAKVRRRVQRDLKRRVGDRPARESVLAALARLLDTTLVRIGNDEYARTNGSFGLTTLRNRHANVKGSTLRLRFKGKHGIVHDVSVDDPRVARVVHCCQAMPGQELFEYEDENGEVRCVGSAEVNDYLREASGADFTAKDFRTWHATVHALELATTPPAVGAQRLSVKEILSEVAARLGNTVAVCRKAYVHPGVLELALEGLAENQGLLVAQELPRSGAGLSPSERRLLAFLSTTKETSHAKRNTRSRKASAGAA